MLSYFALTATVVMTACSSPRRSCEQTGLISDRLADAQLQETMIGALAWLEDNQIRDRPGRGTSIRDSTSDGDGCRARVRVNAPLLPSLLLPPPKWLPIHNFGGEWVSEIHFLPGRWTFGDLGLVAIQDSDLFSSTSTALPLSLFDDGSLPADQRFVTGMLHRAHTFSHRFRKKDGYTFWTKLPPVEGTVPRTGPLNIPISIGRASAAVAINDSFSDFARTSPDAPRGFVTRRLFWKFFSGAKTPGRQLPTQWLAACLNPKTNSEGADSLFNIPADADDTALSAALWHLIGMRSSPQSFVDRQVLAGLERFRDLGRTREDGRDDWKRRNSGSFLTWLASESEPTFNRPHRGVIPLGVNNVDAVVNANVVYALALTDRRNAPGYDDAVRIIALAVEKRAWPEAGLYYPQPMMFPYAATRAFRDGGARTRPMQVAMGRLLIDLLQIHADWAHSHPLKKGGFPGGADSSEALATALGLNAMLNIGAPIARSLGLEERYQKAVNQSVSRLIANRNKSAARDPATRKLSGRCVVSWRAGAVFASSFQGLAQWRSEAQTTAIALEALARFAMAYDQSSPSNPAPRLQLAKCNHSPSGLRLLPQASGAHRH